MLGMRSSGDIERLDSELVSRAWANAALRLRLGQVLAVLGRGAVFDLGFSSLGAYAVERCERSARWAEGASALARQLEALPALRWRVAFGELSWSMAELLVRVATPASEARWLELAECQTVRQVRALVAAAADAVAAAAGEVGAVVDEVREGGAASLQCGGAGEVCTLTCTVALEDVWLFEATRYLLEQLGARGVVDQTEALLAEAQSTLLALLPRGVLELGATRGNEAAQRRWLEQLQRWRSEAEALCETNILEALRAARSASTDAAPALRSVAIEASLGMAALEHAPAALLDQEVRRLAGALARHELELSRLIQRFHRADGWRRLGYASEAQYARERLGLSRSSLRARRALALRLERLPQVAAALATAQIGVEAALQLVRIATTRTELDWVERAKKRTIKHLREEVSAALVAVRVSGERECWPPRDTEVTAFQTLERNVVSGEFARGLAGRGPDAGEASAPTGGHRLSTEPVSEQRRAWCVMLRSLVCWIAGACQTSGARSNPAESRPRSPAGRVPLRLRMSRETYVWWRELEAQARRWLPAGMSWLRFLCLSVWGAWGHWLGADVAYARVYARDRYRCASPVCNRRDVTPHHLQFRSAGGSDEDHNVASVCTWCHLHGVHGGRIQARGRAEHIHWEFGSRGSPSVIVCGRERRAA
jgi:hypothetical protein